MDRLPDDLEIHIEIAVGQGIPHLVSELERNFLMRLCKLRVVLANVVRRFADDLERPNDGILRLLVLQKSRLIDICYIALAAVDRIQNVAQVSTRRTGSSLLIGAAPAPLPAGGLSRAEHAA